MALVGVATGTTDRSIFSSCFGSYQYIHDIKKERHVWGCIKTMGCPQRSKKRIGVWGTPYFFLRRKSHAPTRIPNLSLDSTGSGAGGIDPCESGAGGTDPCESLGIVINHDKPLSLFMLLTFLGKVKVHNKAWVRVHHRLAQPPIQPGHHLNSTRDIC